MTHFNHEWDTTKTPAVPVSVGDRFYAQDLNDDFNYLKHLPYEIFLQGRFRGVIATPNDTWDNETNVLTLSGGFGVVLQDCVELNPDEDFVIPPKTHSSPRYERIPFVDTMLVLPNDGAMHYIVATPTKRSLLQRTKALFAEQYASRIRYDGVITIQDTAPTTEQILVGLCYDKEYCLLTDIDPNQCKDNIILKKWFGQNKTTQNFVSVLQYYYNTTVDSIETKIIIDTINNDVRGISDGTFNNCTISINTINSAFGIYKGTFNNCTISIDTIDYAYGINGGTFNNCTISINTIDSGRNGIYNGTFNNCTISINTINAYGINKGTFNNCTISIDTINSSAYGIVGGAFNNCIVSIDTMSGTSSVRGISDGTFNNCIVSINTMSGTSSVRGITGGTFSNCTISINTIDSAVGISDSSAIYLYLTRIICSSITSLSGTSGKLNVLNNTVLHAS